MTKNLPEKQGKEENRTKHEEKTGLTAFWQDVVGTDQKPSASERHNYYIQTGAVWLSFKKLVEENEELSHYRTNIAFNMSSDAGRGIKQGDMPFYYPPGKDNIHPLDFYVPVDHVIESLEAADRFALNIERMINGDRFEKTRPQKQQQEGFFSKLLFKIFYSDLDEDPKLQKLIKRLNPSMSYDEKHLELNKLMVQALYQNKDLVKHKDELNASHWEHYDPASGKPSPFFLSPNAVEESFDLTMRREKPKTPTRKFKR